VLPSVLGESSALREHRFGPILWLEINRQSVHNALNAEVFASLDRALSVVSKDPSVRVLVIGGAGDRAFSAGADLDEIAGLSFTEGQDLLVRGHSVFQCLADLPLPSIAAVNGLALGGGFELALACTFIIGSTAARFGLPETGLGLMPGYGGTQRLPLAIGKATALRVMLAGELLDAKGASDSGLLALPPVAPDQLVDSVLDFAGKLANRAPLATARVLEAVRHSSDGTPSGMVNEVRLAAACISEAEAAEGISAFRDRREPEFADQRP
jgi:enoyl-CoA hydratase